MRLIPALGAALLLSVSAAIPASAQQLTVRFAWYMPPHTATANQGEAIAKNIERLSNGQIKVETYPSGSLLKEFGMAQGIANNTVNMGIMAIHWWANQEPALEFDTIPFLLSEPKELLPALHGQIGQDINQILNKHNVEVAGWGFYGYAESYINTKHPIKVPTDLKGLKMRSEGKLNAHFLKAEGAVPVAIDSAEVYTALQRGTLDGAVSGLSSIVGRKWYEVGKYITAIHYVPLIYPTMVNAKWWHGLTDKQRSIIEKAIQEGEQSNLVDIEKLFKEEIDTAKKQGDQVYQPSEAELKKWKAATEEMAKKEYLQQAGKTGQKILDDLAKAAPSKQG
ncbi:MAG TPA: TRAP transporter substrate-binding protein DctP [Pseudolabrys sp.]|jgi:TRAP-type C4-dicarboxylate transport system substrate-binding protein|nr:TRAP transporter substrate-binding protein DctP [Pseudolabrys sp.]